MVLVLLTFQYRNVDSLFDASLRLTNVTNPMFYHYYFLFYIVYKTGL